MATIVTRSGKGSPLTHAEVDANFENLNTDKAEVSSLGTAAAADATDFVSQTSATGAAVIPAGTEAQRPTPATGQLRFNTEAISFEGYDGTAWGSIGGAGGGLFKGENGEVGSSAGDIFRINEQTLNTSTTIDADENASCTGPLTVASGVTLTVNGNLAVI